MSVTFHQDNKRYSGIYVSLNDRVMSYVDVVDPFHLEFDYIKRITEVIEAKQDEPLTFLHIGGGGLTLPRWAAAKYPACIQYVIEQSQDMVNALVQTGLSPAGTYFHSGSAEEVIHLGIWKPKVFHVIVVDCMDQTLKTPQGLLDDKGLEALDALLAGNGVLIYNLIGGVDDEEAATRKLRENFIHVFRMDSPHEEAQFNSVLVASDWMDVLDETRATRRAEADGWNIDT